MGATGLLGREVLNCLRRHDASLHLIAGVRTTATTSSEPLNCDEQIQIDLAGDINLPQGLDVVIHAAGEKRDESVMDLVNHQGAEKLAIACVASDAKRLVLVSSVGVYGTGRSKRDIQENDTKSPGNSYEKSKLLGELAVVRVTGGKETESVIVRPSTVLGLEENINYPLLGLMRSIKDGRIRLVKGRQAVTNFVGVKDAAEAIAFISLVESPRPSYIVNTPILLRELVHFIATKLGVSTSIKYWPLFIFIGLDALAVIFRFIGLQPLISRDQITGLISEVKFLPSLLVQGEGFSYPRGILLEVEELSRIYRQRGLL